MVRLTTSMNDHSFRCPQSLCFDQGVPSRGHSSFSVWGQAFVFRSGPSFRVPPSLVGPRPSVPRGARPSFFIRGLFGPFIPFVPYPLRPFVGPGLRFRFNDGGGSRRPSADARQPRLPTFDGPAFVATAWGQAFAFRFVPVTETKNEGLTPRPSSCCRDEERRPDPTSRFTVAETKNEGLAPRPGPLLPRRRTKAWSHVPVQLLKRRTKT